MPTFKDLRTITTASSAHTAVEHKLLLPCSSEDYLPVTYMHAGSFKLPVLKYNNVKDASVTN